MKDITQLINKKSYEENHLLKPKPIPQYKGAKSGVSDFKKRTVLFSFPDSECIQRLGKIVTVNAYIENNCHDISFLMELVRLVESGRVEWDKNKKRYYIKVGSGGMVRI
jgi:hypothetical protein